MGAELKIPDEAEEFRFYCSCGCGRMGFQLDIGVTATEPFHSNGLNAVCVEVSRYTLTVSGMAGGYVYPAETVMDEVRSATETTLAELEAVINELTGHRDRLRSELKVIDERDWDGD